MTQDIARPIKVPEDKKTEFRALTSVPEVSWPVIFVAVAGLVLGVSIVTIAVSGLLAYWVAALLLAFVYYWFFSVIHDGAHRSIAKNKSLNDFVAQLVITLVLPYANLETLRWAHMEHHRFTNEKEKDPDYWSHGAWYTLPFRWMLIDVMYMVDLCKSTGPQKNKLVKKLIPHVLFGFAVIAGLVYFGYGYEYLWLSLIPSRIMFVFIGFTFFWLPHNHWSGDEAEYEQRKNYSIATSIREGREGLMNFLLQYQNYHLVHHMWPTTPFYNNEKVFRLLESEFRQRDLFVAKDFDVFPSAERVEGSKV